jgi:hypothetical protein
LTPLHKKGINVLENYRHAFDYFENPNNDAEGDSPTYIGVRYLSGIALPEDGSLVMK